MTLKVFSILARSALVAAFGVLVASDGFAAAIWTNAASGFWRDSINWSGGNLPSLGGVYVTNANTKTVTIDALTQPVNLAINSLNVWAPVNATNTLRLSDVGVDRPLLASNSTVDIRMRGALEITNSSLVVTSVFAGSGISLNIWAGSVTLDSGSIVVRESSAITNISILTRVGRTNIAALNINGGSMFSSMMQVGQAGLLNARSHGTIRMRGGLLTVPGEFSIGTSLNCTGVVDMAGGQIVVPNNLTNITRIGDQGVGLMVVSNASVSVGDTSVGRHDNSVGTVVLLDNGFLGGSDDFSIGRFGNSTGMVFMAGGQFVVTNHPIWVGREGMGQLVVSNGLVSAPGLRVATELTNTAAGSVLIAGGTAIASSNLIVGNIGFSTGQVAVVGGSLLVSNVDQTAVLNVASGALILEGGTVSADSLVLTNEGVMTISSGKFISSGTIVSNGQPFVIGDGTNTAVMELRGGTHVFADGLVISPNATLTGCGSIIGTIENNGINNVNCDGPGLHPFIIQQPTDQTTTAGNMAAFNVVATSGTPVTYQWRYNGNAMSGANGDTFSIASAQPSDVGGYDVIVSNDSGSITSRVAALTLATSPVITVQPATQSVSQNSPVTLTVTAVGSAPLSYQWLINSNVISGATSSTFTIPSAQPTDSGDYNVVVSNPVGTVTSLVATILVLVPPTISAQPVSQNISSNSPVSFSVIASGSPALLYQWRYNGAPIAGATDPNFSLANAQLTNAGFYSVVIRNPVGVVTSQVANLTFLGPPTIIVQPASQTNARNSTVTFSVVASGTSPLSYRWRFNNNNISGATSSSYTRSGLGNSDAGNYTVVVTNSSGAVTSQVAVLTVLTTVSITTQPSSQTITQGVTAVLRVVASGSNPLSYQWRFAPVGRAESILSGATSATLTLTNPQFTNAGSYRVVVSNPVSAVTSRVATVTLLVPPPLLTITTTGGTASVRCQSLTGLNYVLDYKDHLNDAAWTSLPGVPGNGATLTLIDPAAIVPTRFYRVRVQ